MIKEVTTLIFLLLFLITAFSIMLIFGSFFMCPLCSYTLSTAITIADALPGKFKVKDLKITFGNLYITRYGIYDAYFFKGSKVFVDLIRAGIKMGYLPSVFESIKEIGILSKVPKVEKLEILDKVISYFKVLSANIKESRIVRFLLKYDKLVKVGGYAAAILSVVDTAIFVEEVLPKIWDVLEGKAWYIYYVNPGYFKIVNVFSDANLIDMLGKYIGISKTPLDYYRPVFGAGTKIYNTITHNTMLNCMNYDISLNGFDICTNIKEPKRFGSFYIQQIIKRIYNVEIIKDKNEIIVRFK